MKWLQPIAFVLALGAILPGSVAAAPVLSIDFGIISMTLYDLRPRTSDAGKATWNTRPNRTVPNLGERTELPGRKPLGTTFGPGSNISRRAQGVQCPPGCDCIISQAIFLANQLSQPKTIGPMPREVSQD